MPRALVIGEIANGKLRSTSLAAMSLAVQATGEPKMVDLIVLGSGLRATVEQLRGHGFGRVLMSDDTRFASPLAEQHVPTLAQVAEAEGYDLVAAGASSFGKDVLPRLAARLGAAYAADCAGVEIKAGERYYRRPMYAGNAYGWCRLGTKCHVIGVRQSEVAPWSPVFADTTAAPVIEVPPAAPSAAAGRLEVVGLEAVASSRPELTDAEVIVAGGRQLKERFFELLEPLADTLGAAIGATRAACDAGFAPGDYQVGQTGKIVAPKLYIAVGISGAIQHLAGMKQSKVIVAINTNPDEPIFQAADYGLVADMFEAVPTLVAALKKQLSKTRAA